MPYIHQTVRIMPLHWLLILAAICLAACFPRKIIVNEMVQTMQIGMRAMEQDDDLSMLKMAFPAHIKQLEGLLISAPENRSLLVMLAKAYAAYGYIYDDTDLEKLRLKQLAVSEQGRNLRLTLNRYYTKGMDYALKALAVHHPDDYHRLAITSENRLFLKSLTKDDVPALFWYAFNLSAYININLDSISILAKGHLAEAAMKRVIELDEGYYHGLAHLVLMAYYGSRSPAMGGDSTLVMAHYKRLQEITAQQLWLSDVYLARFVSYHEQDRLQFVSTLEEVINRTGSSPSFRMLNQAAKERARIYLDATDYLFDEP